MSQTELTPEQIRQSIVPKSDQLNADELITGPITVTVLSVAAGDKEQPISIAIDGGHQPYKPCKSMRRVLIAAWGDKGKDWVGRRMTLFCDPTVKWAGVEVGGVRISHLSDIPADREFNLTVTRGKRTPYQIKRLEDPQVAAQETADEISRAIEGGDRGELFRILNGIAAADKPEIWSLLSDEEKEAIRAAKAGN